MTDCDVDKNDELDEPADDRPNEEDVVVCDAGGGGAGVSDKVVGYEGGGGRGGGRVGGDGGGNDGGGSKSLPEFDSLLETFFFYNFQFIKL